MRRKTLAISFLSALALLLSTTASAELIEYDFESNELSDWQDPNDVGTIEDSSSGQWNAKEGDYYLEVVHSADAWRYVSNSFNEYQPEQISFSFIRKEGDGYDTGAAEFLDSNGNVVMDVTTNDGGDDPEFLIQGTIGLAGGQWQAGEWYDVKFNNIDYANNEIGTVEITGAGITDTTAQDVAFANSASGIAEARFGGDTRASGGVQPYLGFDDISIGTFSLPTESAEVTNESTNLITGDFALTSSAGIYAGVKGISAAAAGLGIWELGVRDWLFGTNDADEQLWDDDIRANAVTLEDNRNNILSASKLSEDALFGDAMAEARAVGVQEYNNGSSKAQAKAKVENTVENYYSDVERVVVTGYNNEILNLQQDYNNAQDLGVSFSKPFKSDFNGLAIVNESYTLPNGESMTTYEVVRDDGARIATLESYEGVGLTTESSADHASASYLEGSAHYDVIQGVRDTRSNAITNVNSIVDNIYNNYNQSQINVSEELSALELVESLSTDYGETGSYDYAAASLARSGQPTDLDSAFNITYNGETMEGALFASDAVVGSQVDVGTTYNGSDGNAVFVKQGEASAELVELEGEFTVNSITSLDDGSELSNTTLQESSVYTNNIQDLQEEINNLETQLNEGSGIGGGLFSGLGADMYVILGLILVLAGALFA